MLMGAYDENIAIGAPQLWQKSDLEALTDWGYNPPGLDTELGLVLDDSQNFYRQMGLDGIGYMGDLEGFFSSIKKAVSKVTKPIQKRITKDVKKIQSLRNKITPKALQKIETKVLKNAQKAATTVAKVQQKITPSFLRKPTAQLTNIVSKVQSKVTPPMIRKVMQDVAIVSPPGLAPGRQQFLSWLQMDNPELYTAVIGQAIAKTQAQAAALPKIPGIPGPTVAALMGLAQAATGTPPAQQQPSIWDNIVSAAGAIIPAVFQAKAQQDLYKVQLERAKNGQPPLKSEEIAPTIKTEVGVSPATIEAAGAGMTKMLIPLGIGAAALFFMMKK
jgi:hypothetical protein